MLLLFRTKWFFYCCLAAAASFFTGCSQSGSNGEVVSSTQVAIVAHTPNNGFNRLTVSVTVCIPGTTTCATVDNIMVDTGSNGLRLQASALPSGFSLPSKSYKDGNSVGECLHFLNNNAWGMIDSADIVIGQMKATAMPVQVVGPDAQRQPSACPSAKNPTSNGTLGLGIRSYDCGENCTMPETLTGLGSVYQYYSCSINTCSPIDGKIDTEYQLPNPTTRLGDGTLNGVVIELPSVPDAGATQVNGTLTFGVPDNWRKNSEAAAIAHLDANGFVTTNYEGISYKKSYIDSGTATYVVPSSTLLRCNGAVAYAYCVSPAAQLSATITDVDATNSVVPFKVGLYPNAGVAEGAAVSATASSPNFVWGAPFFFGKRVAVVRSGANLSGSTVQGPLYSWQPTTIAETGK